MILCVTGSMASGKNVATSVLEKMGFTSIDADLVGHDAVEECKSEILSAFAPIAKKHGINLLSSNGKINRRALGKLIFGNKELVKKHESIVFPYINSVLEKFISDNQKLEKPKNLVINAAVLFKVSVIKKVDYIIFIDAPFLVRFFRVRKRDRLPYLQIFHRFRSQFSLFLSYKKSGVPIVRISNTGSLSLLQKKIERLNFVR